MNNYFDNYKPKILEDINLSDETIHLINTYLNNNKLIFLIYGEIGCGKTSLIKIILHLYYKCNNYDNNIIYINLLKDQVINYFRNEIKNFCQMYNSKKSYPKNTIIIDDFHYLNEINQKILINYINKYTNINFILSCSDLDKITFNTTYILELIKIQNIDDSYLEKF